VRRLLSLLGKAKRMDTSESDDIRDHLMGPEGSRKHVLIPFYPHRTASKFCLLWPNNTDFLQPLSGPILPRDKPSSLFGSVGRHTMGWACVYKTTSQTVQVLLALLGVKSKVRLAVQQWRSRPPCVPHHKAPPPSYTHQLTLFTPCCP